MSEKYRLIKHNENLAEIGNDRGVGLLFIVDKDCERKLGIIVDCLNEQQATIESLQDILKNMIEQIEWDSSKPYISVRIVLNRELYYDLKKVMNNE